MPNMADIKFMEQVLHLAEKGWGKAAPNPMVGALLVKNGKVLGTGYHKGPGRKHAEIEAINSVTTNPKNSTLYVNLEPCCHTGRTGPCTEAVIKAGIKRVVYCHKDPNPLVNGKGISILKKAGIETTGNILKKEAQQLNEIYLNQFKNIRPFVILKLATSLDGQIATATGDSNYISSTQALKYVHRLRAQVDAILVGSKTAVNDNPTLTTRLFKGDNPYRIVAASDAASLKNLNLIKNNSDYKTIIASTEKSLKKFITVYKKKSPICWTIKANGKNLSPADLLAKAADYGLQSILLEGGGQLAASFLKANLVDKIIFISSPILLGSGIPSIGNMNINKITNGLKLTNMTYQQAGPDQIITAYPEKTRGTK